MSRSSGVPAIELERLSCRYDGAPGLALEEINLVVNPGEIVAIMGHSGAGKSTLLKCMTGIIPSFAPGQVSGVRRVLGLSLDVTPPGALAGRVGMVFQDFEAQLFSTNVALEVGFGLDQVGVAPGEIDRRTRDALAQVGLSGFEPRDPATLSGGEKQRLAIAAIWALAPEVILLDEPTTDVDPLGKQAIFDLLLAFRSSGAAVVVVEHESAAAAVADRLVLLAGGRVRAAGPSSEILGDVRLLEECGVRPRDLDAIPWALGSQRRLESIDEAEVWLRSQGIVPDLRALDDREAGESGRASPEADGASLFELSAVRHVYPSGLVALDGVSMGIERGEFIALIGQNGSGKTTLAKHLNGLLHPTSGSVHHLGKDTRSLGLGQIARSVGFVFQDPDHQLFCESVAAEIAFGPHHLGLPIDAIGQRVERCLELAGLAAHRDDDPFLLSKGERERLAVASVLALEPEVLILDEPTTGLDYREQRGFLDFLRELNASGTTVIVITHAPWLVAEYASRAVLMARGRVLFDGPVRRLFGKPDLLASASFVLPEATALGMRFNLPARSLAELVTALRGAGTPAT